MMHIVHGDKAVSVKVGTSRKSENVQKAHPEAKCGQKYCLGKGNMVEIPSKIQ
jgi:hypothetical protein